jgi:hypothetical protein
VLAKVLGLNEMQWGRESRGFGGCYCWEGCKGGFGREFLDWLGLKVVMQMCTVYYLMGLGLEACIGACYG